MLNTIYFIKARYTQPETETKWSRSRAPPTRKYPIRDIQTAAVIVTHNEGNNKQNYALNTKLTSHVCCLQR